MSYIEALEAAGATVLATQSFGSWQGEWLALVEYKGVRGFVAGSYGSCSGCDAFEAEFGYRYEGCSEHTYQPQTDCEECKSEAETYEKRLADFGRSYMDDADGNAMLDDYDRTLSNASANVSWDAEAEQMVAWVESQKGAYDGV